jgi:hypothetical protein
MFDAIMRRCLVLPFLIFASSHVGPLLSKVLYRPSSALNSARWAAKAQTRIVTVELAPAVAMLASPEMSVQSISMNPPFRIERLPPWPRKLHRPYRSHRHQ